MVTRRVNVVQSTNWRRARSTRNFWNHCFSQSKLLHKVVTTFTLQGSFYFQSGNEKKFCSQVTVRLTNNRLGVVTFSLSMDVSPKQRSPHINHVSYKCSLTGNSKTCPFNQKCAEFLAASNINEQCSLDENRIVQR